MPCARTLHRNPRGLREAGFERRMRVLVAIIYGLCLSIGLLNGSALAVEPCPAIWARVTGGSARLRQLLDKGPRLVNLFPIQGQWGHLKEAVSRLTEGQTIGVRFQDSKVAFDGSVGLRQGVLTLRIDAIRSMDTVYGARAKNLILPYAVSSLLEGVRLRFEREPNEIRQIRIEGKMVMNEELGRTLESLGFVASTPKIMAGGKAVGLSMAALGVAIAPWSKGASITATVFSMLPKGPNMMWSGSKDYTLVLDVTPAPR